MRTISSGEHGTEYVGSIIICLLDSGHALLQHLAQQLLVVVALALPSLLLATQIRREAGGFRERSAHEFDAAAHFCARHPGGGDLADDHRCGEANAGVVAHMRLLNG